MSTRIAYLRSADGCPIGCLAIDVSSEGETSKVSYQLSVLNPVDSFDRSLARSIATGRLTKSPRVIAISKGANMHVITHAIMTDLVVRSKLDIPNRARHAAKLWLKTYYAKFLI